MAYKIKFKTKLKIYQWIIGFVILFMAVITCYAATTEPSWAEHIDLMSVLISSLFIIITWFVIKTLRTFEDNQNLLFNKYNDLHDRVAHLEGAHEARTGQKVSC